MPGGCRGTPPGPCPDKGSVGGGRGAGGGGGGRYDGSGRGRGAGEKQLDEMMAPADEMKQVAVVEVVGMTGPVAAVNGQVNGQTAAMLFGGGVAVTDQGALPRLLPSEVFVGGCGTRR